MRAMQVKRARGLSVAVLTLLGAYTNANAQLPPSFPTLVISSNGPVAPGDFIGTLGANAAAGIGYKRTARGASEPSGVIT